LPPPPNKRYGFSLWKPGPAPGFFVSKRHRVD
jgi:hypothetical protein